MVFNVTSLYQLIYNAELGFDTAVFSVSEKDSVTKVKRIASFRKIKNNVYAWDDGIDSRNALECIEDISKYFSIGEFAMTKMLGRKPTHQESVKFSMHFHGYNKMSVTEKRNVLSGDYNKRSIRVLAYPHSECEDNKIDIYYSLQMEMKKYICNDNAPIISHDVSVSTVSKKIDVVLVNDDILEYFTIINKKKSFKGIKKRLKELSMRADRNWIVVDDSMRDKTNEFINKNNKLMSKIGIVIYKDGVISVEKKALVLKNPKFICTLASKEKSKILYGLGINCLDTDDSTELLLAACLGSKKRLNAIARIVFISHIINFIKYRTGIDGAVKEESFLGSIDILKLNSIVYGRTKAIELFGELQDIKNI